MELSLGGHEYRTGRLDAFQQFHIARKIAPVLAAFARAAADSPELLPSPESPASDDISLAKVIGPIADALSSMPDKDAESVVAICLSVCTRSAGANQWSRVMSPGNSPRLMFEDLTLTEMMGITINTITENMGSFFDMTKKYANSPPT